LFVFVDLSVSAAHAQDRGRASSPVAGIVQEVLVKNGDKVQRGQVLAKLDDRLARVDAEIAGARLHAAEADMVQAEAEVKHADANLRRLKELAKSGVVSQPDLLAAEMEFPKSRARLEGRRAHVVVARLQLKRAEIIVDMHIFRSPIDGTIARITRRAGEGIAARELFAEIDRAEEKK
jgi:multidrug resistance efflux pump